MSLGPSPTRTFVLHRSMRRNDHIVAQPRLGTEWFVTIISGVGRDQAPGQILYKSYAIRDGEEPFGVVDHVFEVLGRELSG